MGINNIVVISDTHCGDQRSLCPKEGLKLLDGGNYKPSKIQKQLYKYWDIFWNEFVPYATRKEPYCIVHNGDIVDGVHHRSTYQFSHNLEDQAECAYQLLSPVVDKAKGNYYQIKGTEAHTGPSGVEEERLARRLGAKPNKEGCYSRFELWKSVGPKLSHFLHHIGGAKSALYTELETMYVESSKWGHRPPDIIVRSHIHQYSCFETPVDSSTRKGLVKGMDHAICVTTPAWQDKTAFTFKINRARCCLPQFGGIVIRYNDNELYIRRKIWTIGRSNIEE